MRILLHAIFLTIVCAGALLSCDRRRVAAKIPAAEKTTTPRRDQRAVAVPEASIQPTTPSTTQSKAPSDSVMVIDQQRIDFPSAKLNVATSDGKVIAMLYSDDPHDAINDQYTGNSFYFQMDLDVADAGDFAAADWRFGAASQDQADSPYGIFLDGHRNQLQPIDVKVSFEPAGPGRTMVWISGRFLLVDLQDATQPSRVVPVAARLSAATIIKE